MQIKKAKLNWPCTNEHKKFREYIGENRPSWTWVPKETLIYPGENS